MVDQPNASDNSANDKKSRNRGAHGLQRIPLKRALEIAKTVQELGQGDPVTRTLVLDHLGKSATSGASATLIGASNTYGLTKSTDEKLELTERGRKIVASETSDRTRRKAIHDAIFSSEIVVACVDRYAEKPLPADAVVVDYLKSNHALSINDAQSLWDVIKANMIEYGLMRDLATGKKMWRSRSTMEAELGSDEVKNTHDDVSKDRNGRATEPSTVDDTPRGVTDKVPMATGAVNPEFHFNIQIHLPSDAKPEQYDAMFKSIAKYLLGRSEE